MSVPLKPLQETFVDDPKEFSDTNIDHLAFDIEHGLKNINNIHSLHAIAILLLCVTDLITLLSHQYLLHQFHREHLWSYTEKLSSLNQSNLPDDISDTSQMRTHISHEERGSHQDRPSKRSKLEEATTIQNNATSSTRRDRLMKAFVLVNQPSVSVKDFLLRINTYSPTISSSVYTHLAQIMLNHVLISQTMRLTKHNVHRLLLTVIRCSTKLLEDCYQKQTTYATVTGVTKPDLLKFELAFLFLSDFDFVVDEKSLDQFLIEKWVPLYRFCRKHLDERNQSATKSVCNNQEVPMD